MNKQQIQIAKTLGCTGAFPEDFNLAVARCEQLLAMLERVTDRLFVLENHPHPENALMLRQARQLIATAKIEMPSKAACLKASSELSKDKNVRMAICIDRGGK